MLRRLCFFDVDGLYSRKIEPAIEKIKIRRRLHTDRGRASKNSNGCQRPSGGQREVMGSGYLSHEHTDSTSIDAHINAIHEYSTSSTLPSKLHEF